MKRKHADLIHAWADGAEIQVKDNDKWLEVTNGPSWDESREYRIKPEEKKPVVRWLWADRFGQVTEALYSESELEADDINDCFQIKLEWSRTEFPE